MYYLAFAQAAAVYGDNLVKMFRRTQVKFEVRRGSFLKLLMLFSDVSDAVLRFTMMQNFKKSALRLLHSNSDTTTTRHFHYTAVQQRHRIEICSDQNIADALLAFKHLD